MTGQQFLQLIEHPGMANDQRSMQLEDLVMRYPYCQSGQLLLACNLFIEELPPAAYADPGFLVFLKSSPPESKAAD